jgi:hypothetical protein
MSSRQELPKDKTCSSGATLVKYDWEFHIHAELPSNGPSHLDSRTQDLRSHRWLAVYSLRRTRISARSTLQSEVSEFMFYTAEKNDMGSRLIQMQFGQLRCGIVNWCNQGRIMKLIKGTEIGVNC